MEFILKALCVFAVIFLVWMRLSNVSLGSATGTALPLFRRMLANNPALTRNSRRKIFGIGLWIVLTYTLWLFSEEIPLWNWWTSNGKFFWVSNVVILLWAVAWEISGWTKWILMALAVTLFWVAPGAKDFVLDVKAGYSSSSPAPSAPTTRPSMKVTVMAPVGEYSDWVRIPPESVFRIQYSGEVKRKDMRGREFDVGPKMAPRMLVDDDQGSFAFRFKSRESEPVMVVVYHHPK